MSVAPPRPKGPPLNAMRAFEAAARLESFVAAAEELSVSPGAVSQHIKTLEAWAGVPLFTRNARAVQLTEAGRKLLPDFVAAFDALGAATQALRSLQPVQEIHIAALPAVAQLWLPPRLERIRAAFPNLRCSVTALETPPNLSRELFDLALFFLPKGEDPDRIVLAEDWIQPVCAPRLNVEAGVFPDAPLMQDQSWHEDWRIWSESSGVMVTPEQISLRYSLYSLAVAEAKAGAGILMGHTCLIEEDLRAGHLVPVSELRAHSGKELVLLLPDASRRNPQVSAIAQMLGRDPDHRQSDE